MKTINKKKMLSGTLLGTFLLFLATQFNAFGQTTPVVEFPKCIAEGSKSTGTRVLQSGPAACVECAITGAGTEVRDPNGKVIGIKYSVASNVTNYVRILCTTEGASQTSECTSYSLVGGSGGSCPTSITLPPSTGTGTGTGN